MNKHPAMMVEARLLLGSNLKQIYPCGSRVICPEGVTPKSDWDCLVLVHSIEKGVASFTKVGFSDSVTNPVKRAQSPGDQASLWCHSMIRGRWNYLVTSKSGWYYKFRLATRVATKLNLVNKPDRIMLFHAICYDKDETGLPLIASKLVSCHDS